VEVSSQIKLKRLLMMVENPLSDRFFPIYASLDLHRNKPSLCKGTITLLVTVIWSTNDNHTSSKKDYGGSKMHVRILAHLHVSDKFKCM
jgi:hypothetical protein